MLQIFFKLADARLGLCLLVLCLVVFAVLGKVAEGKCDPYRLNDFLSFGGLQVLKLILELFKSLFGDCVCC